MWGKEPNPANYIAYIALEANDASGGFAVLDMQAVVDAFDKGTEIDETLIQYIALGKCIDFVDDTEA